MLDAIITKQKIVNGVNVDELFATIDAIKVEPEIAKFNFRATNRWVVGGNNQTTVNEYSGACQEFSRDEPFVFQKDEPPVLLGTDKGANPDFRAFIGIVFEPNITFTMEPLYMIPGEMGFHVEDMYVITKDGFDALTGAIRPNDELIPVGAQ